MADVVVVGSFVQDQIWRVDRFPDAGETRRAEGFVAGAGGKGFNQAVASARQGAATAFVGAVGDDAGGRAARASAAADAIAARWQVVADAPTGSAGILVDRSGQNRIVVALGANEHLDPAFVHAQAALLGGARVVLAQLENQLDATRAALAAAASGTALRVLDPAPAHDGVDAALLALCDLITPNETEFAGLLEHVAGVRVDAAALAARSDAELHALARRLPVATVVVTLGARGCFVSHADARRRGDDAACYRLAPEPVAAIDATGAGDAFAGALAAALVRFGDAPFRDAARHANRCAALSTECVGTVAAMPRFDDVRHRFGA
ncbi:MAG TPA: PfkB family carbohydrate kinase [Dokdonella sp.]